MGEECPFVSALAAYGSSDYKCPHTTGEYGRLKPISYSMGADGQTKEVKECPFAGTLLKNGYDINECPHVECQYVSTDEVDGMGADVVAHLYDKRGLLFSGPCSMSEAKSVLPLLEEED